MKRLKKTDRIQEINGTNRLKEISRIKEINRIKKIEEIAEIIKIIETKSIKSIKSITGAVVLIAAWLILVSCGAQETSGEYSANNEDKYIQTEYLQEESDTFEAQNEETGQDGLEAETDAPLPEAVSQETALQNDFTFTELTFINHEIPVFSGNAYAVINNNIPYFADKELPTESFEYYSELDSLGRCGVCIANVSQDTMPTEERGEIGNIKPTGWHTVKYSDIIEGNYLYNRCHLIAFQLAGENANVNNLITGPRYLNVEGMLPFENMVADFVRETGYHVMYRVTPVFNGDNLVADGVLMEAESVEDNGGGILFNVFCYNVQPGISIDYATGNSAVDESSVSKEDITSAEEVSDIDQAQEITPAGEPEPEPSAAVSVDSGAYAVNSKNGKIHITGKCSATGNGSNAMKAPVYFGTYEEAEAYSIRIAPSQEKRKCGNCW